MAHLLEVNWRELWSESPQPESLGAVYTKPAVVDFILSLAGYEPLARRLRDCALLEPSCGDGAFIDLVVERLVKSELHFAGSIDWNDPAFDQAIVATDISERSVAQAREVAGLRLRGAGCPDQRADEICARWFCQTDFLLETWTRRFDFVIGNPPYIRIESIPKSVLSRYRQLYPTTSDRADLYVAFFERGLELLTNSGVLGFICANRFVKNKYGAPLRKLIAKHYKVKYYVNLEHTQPFQTEVSAYPAILIIDQVTGERDTFAATLDGKIEPLLVESLAEARGTSPLKIFQVFDSWYPDGSPWISTCNAKMTEINDFEQGFPSLEESAADTRIGIGVATGADRVFVLDEKRADIEDDRLLPLLMASDVTNQSLEYSGHFLVNPFNEDGALVSFSEYPALAAYLEARSEVLRKRHVSKGRPNSWYRTIDRIWPSWVKRPKLMIPDIKGTAHVGYDKGDYYPHHNLYWITSGEWPLLALKTILRSKQVHRQVEAYSVQMRGGALRFQAQTLRKVRVPSLKSLSEETIATLESVSTACDQKLIDDAAGIAYHEHLNRHR